MRLSQCIEGIYLHHWFFLCFFVFYPIKRIWIWSTRFQIYLLTFVRNCKKLIQSKIKSLPFTDVSKPFLVSIKKWLREFFSNFSMFSSVTSLFKCITCSSSRSLKQKKLIAIVTWIFHVSCFRRKFMMSFRYGLIFSRCFLIDRVLFLSPLLPLFPKLPTLTGL